VIGAASHVRRLTTASAGLAREDCSGRSTARLPLLKS